MAMSSDDKVLTIGDRLELFVKDIWNREGVPTISLSGLALTLSVALITWGAAVFADEQEAAEPVQIGDRLELFVDTHLVKSMDNTELRLRRPHPATASGGPSGAYMTVIRDGDRFLGYYRAVAPDYDGPRRDGHPGERTCVVKSADGIHWETPDLGTEEDMGYPNVLRDIEPPRTHNFSPFLDTRDGVSHNERFKAVAGVRRGAGVHVFGSPDGLTWHLLSDEPVFRGGNLDSQNVAFWSETEGRYELYYRKHNRPRTVDRIVSECLLDWEHEPVAEPNLDGREHLYTTQTHPYFRAPHIYIALPTRYTHGQIGGEEVSGNIGSTDIMLMSKRAGADAYERTFDEAFIRPGPDPGRWGSRNNFMALNVVPTGPAEMSIYHRDGTRYVLRTDGFASVYGPPEGGELVTRPVVFKGRELVLNLATAVRGGVRVELQDADGVPIPGFTLDDCPAIIGDSVGHVVAWRNGSDVGELAGRPVRLRFELRDADIYSYQFRQ